MAKIVTFSRPDEDRVKVVKERLDNLSSSLMGTMNQEELKVNNGLAPDLMRIAREKEVVNQVRDEYRTLMREKMGNDGYEQVMDEMDLIGAGL